MFGVPQVGLDLIIVSPIGLQPSLPRVHTCNVVRVTVRGPSMLRPALMEYCPYMVITIYLETQSSWPSAHAKCQADAQNTIVASPRLACAAPSVAPAGTHDGSIATYLWTFQYRMGPHECSFLALSSLMGISKMGVSSPLGTHDAIETG
jgi:hypothetical protein